MEQDIRQFVQHEIDQKHIPGAVIQVNHKGETLFEEAFGQRIDYENEQAPMQINTVFDLASLTKVVATLPAILKLIDTGKIWLGDKVAHFLPEFAENDKDQVTIQYLLTHTSGLTSHRKFYQENLKPDEIYEAIYDETLEYEPGTKVVYSDLGFILLRKIVEEVTETAFDEFVQQEIFEPLGMRETTFLPEFPKERYAATEYDENLNTYKIGIVHDENTEALGGISGHAGLFSTIKDLNHYITMIENGGCYKNQRILSPNVLQLARQSFTSSLSEERGLGWQKKTGNQTACGDYFSNQSYGHTGFTGTSIWFDPTVDLNVILLTNRVHYGREPYILRLRPRLHNLIRQSFN